MTDKQHGGMFSSTTDEWATPQGFFDELDEEFHFTLDPAASEENHKCETFFTKEQNGLDRSWGGYTAFCNPPYGPGDRKVGTESVGGARKARRYHCYAAPGADGYPMVPQIHLWQSRDPLCARTAEIRRGGVERAVPEHGRNLPQKMRLYMEMEE